MNRFPRKPAKGMPVPTRTKKGAAKIVRKDDNSSSEEVGPSDDEVPAERKGTTHKKAKEPAQKGGPVNRDTRKRTISDSDEDGQEYEVEKLVNVRTVRGRREFLIKWRNYPRNENSWEPECNLNCKDLLEAFEKTTEAEANKRQKVVTGRRSDSKRQRKTHRRKL